MSKFAGPDAYGPASGTYRLLPFRFVREKGGEDVLVVNEVGEHVFLAAPTFEAFVHKRLQASTPAFDQLLARHFLYPEGDKPPIEALAVKYRTRKAFVLHGPALHIFVVTLRCDHTCQYCQVSRRLESEARFDMSEETARHGVRIALECPADAITIEFQGGEPLLAFDLIRFTVEEATRQNASVGKHITFVIASTLHHLTPSMLDYCKANGVKLSTSLDGPSWLHNKNRPLPTRDSWERTVMAIDRARAVLGEDGVAALTTLTSLSLTAPGEIIDAYRERGFRSIFLRPLSPYGFAVRNKRREEYSAAEFLTFYDRALDRLIEINKGGYTMDEVYTTLLLRAILTPFSHGYVDLRSPYGLGTFVYNYDGDVYPSDEARMLVEMGETMFRLGAVSQPYAELINAPAMQLLLSGGVAEAIPSCTSCAYLPYCGSDPVDSFARQGDVIGHRPSSRFCEKQTGLFERLFARLKRGDPDEMAVFLSWITGKSYAEIRGRAVC